MIVLIDSQRERREAVQEEVGSDVTVEWVVNSSALDGLLNDPTRFIEAVLIGPGIDFEHALKAIERLGQHVPELGVIALVEQVTTAELRRAMKAGALDLLDAKRSPGELRDAVDRARSRYRQLHAHDDAEPDHPGGRVVVVFSTKGGCGKSFIASNLAVAVAERLEGEVGLIDLDLQSGDLAIMLQLLPAWTAYDAALQGVRLDHEALRGYLTSHRSGVRLLAAPTDPAVSEHVSPESVQHLLALMRTLFPITIIDSPAFFSEQVLASIDACDEVVLVGSLDVPSVKNLKLALQTLDALKVGRERIRVVLNRADTSVGLRIQEVERSLGTEVDVSVPSSRDVPLSINQGEPLVMSKRKRSSVVAALEALAKAVAGPVEAESQTIEPQRRRRGRRRQEEQS